MPGRILTLDIETLPAPPEMKAVILAELEAAGFKPPSNIKDPEKIYARKLEWAAGLAGDADAQWRRTGLDATAGGRILCIGYALDGDEPQVLAAEDPEEEVGILEQFWGEAIGALDGIDGTGLLRVIVGHNVLDFDLPFMLRRSIILGVQPPHLPLRRYSSSPIFDTMWEWAFWNRDQTCSLDKLCKALGITSSKAGGLDGSKVCGAYYEGRLAEIVEYCAADVVATREVYRRMTFSARGNRLSDDEIDQLLNDTDATKEASQ
jgi:3'-5' exonuclease